ncbi:hypothetical protein GC177_03520 [bacterium]|nr:hypothetical protein [bacterium]
MNALITHCTGLFASGNLPFYLVFFLGGLTGGFTHCMPMCGPLVGAETAACSRCGSCGTGRTIARSLGVNYHLGRATTYMLLGGAAAVLSSQIAASPYWPWVSAAMLMLAGFMFLASGLPFFRHIGFFSTGRLTYLRGLFLGFMPCGLLYAALMMAATMANPLKAMLAMFFFFAGTLPALFIASIGTELLSRKWQFFMQKLGRAVMAFNGVALLVMAERLVAR